MLAGSSPNTGTVVIGTVTGAVTVGVIPVLVLGMAFIAVTAASTTSACQMQGAGQPEGSSAAGKDIPAAYLPIYQKTGNAYRIPWNILAAIGKIESDHGRYPGSGVRSGSNYAGAAGPMQIGVGGAAGNSWGRFATDGNSDGRKDVHDPRDAIPAAARILIEDKGFRKGARDAVRRYNGSGPKAEAYADRAMALAGRYTAQGAGTAGPAAVGVEGICAGAGPAGFRPPQGPDTHGNWPAEQPGPDNITPRTRRVRDLIKNQFKVPKGIGCYREGPNAQDHGKGRACDAMVSSGGRDPNPGQIRLGFDIANWSTSNAAKLGIHYVIYRQHIWNIERSREGWRPMGNRGGITANHFDHVHISVY